MAFCLLIICVYISKCLAQTCLINEPSVTHNAINNDIEWIPLNDNTYHTTLIYDVSTFEWSTINTRLIGRFHNNSMPSPTLRMKRGNTYKITLINNLGPESTTNPTGANVQKDPNTTNIHTHGLHIGGRPPGDNVYVSVSPGMNYTYTYNIPCDHSGGTMWYHPHHHGSTFTQVAQGCAGALIIDDDSEFEGLSDWYVNMTSYVLVMSYLDLGMLNNRINTNPPPGYVDDIFTWESITNGQRAAQFFLINGQYQPYICVNAGEWVKLKMVHHDALNQREFFITGCTIKLLASDGVIIHGRNDTDLPRDVNSIWFGQPNRRDVAVFCPGSGMSTTDYPITTQYRKGGNNPQILTATVGYIRVMGSITTPDYALTPFTPKRPFYLQNLLNYQGPLPQGNPRNIQVTPTSLGGQSFAGELNYLFEVDINTIQNINIQMGNVVDHPFHMHVNHFQIITPGTNAIPVPNGYQVIGDFADTYIGPGLVRFKTDGWGGTVTMHCHILEHEDDGAMGTFLIRGGCDNDLVTDFMTQGSCNYNTTQCKAMMTTPPSDSPTQSPTTFPSMTPTAFGETVAPTLATELPTNQPSLSPTFNTIEPTISPGNGPTLSPSLMPSLNPSLSPTESPVNSTNLSGNQRITVYWLSMILCIFAVFLFG